MKNPIKNGKEVFAVLSMATVMSISMSVKVDAASELDSVAEKSAKAAVEITVKESNEASTESPTSKEEVSSTQDTKEDKKDTEATEQGSSDVTEAASRTKDEKTTFSKYGEEKESTLELGEENVNEPLGSTGESKNDAEVLADKGSPTSEENVEGIDGQVEAPEVNDDGVSTNSEGNVEGKDKETDVPQAEDAENSEENSIENKTQGDRNLDVSDEKPTEAQKAAAENSEPNYSEDEKKIKNYSGEERYRSTQMEQGKGTAADFTPPDEKNEFVDGYRYHSSEPSGTSEDKTQWGVEMEFDKEKGQRTYTDFYFTNTGNMGGVLDNGNVSANEAGKKIAGGEKDPNYKATSEIEIDGFRNQRNLNLYATEEDIKHINDIDNTNTTMGLAR
ncbi:adhesin domain containing protein [uncultured Peptoniphilus sp.]|uniref:adhesin domain containing protein n=1 Tax=uncultured Peptoniphilus sp. TaxID=254354 RepID=UPI0025E434C0|nr:adhesin domain containing protein [uncultured Peptoniphilus sp.]